MEVKATRGAKWQANRCTTRRPLECSASGKTLELSAGKLKQLSEEVHLIICFIGGVLLCFIPINLKTGIEVLSGLTWVEVASMFQQQDFAKTNGGRGWTPITDIIYETHLKVH